MRYFVDIITSPHRYLSCNLQEGKAMSTLSGKYRCELCKHDFPIDPPFEKDAIMGVDISQHNTKGISLGRPQDHPIHICDRCIQRIKEL